VPAKLAFLLGTVIFMTMKDPVERPQIKAVARDICHQEDLFCHKCRPKAGQWDGLITRSGWSEPVDPRKFAHCVTLGSLPGLTYLRVSAEDWNGGAQFFQERSRICHALERDCYVPRPWRFANRTQYEQVRRRNPHWSPEICDCGIHTGVQRFVIVRVNRQQALCEAW